MTDQWTGQCALRRVALVEWKEQCSDLSGAMRPWEDLRVWVTRCFAAKESKETGRLLLREEGLRGFRFLLLGRWEK